MGPCFQVIRYLFVTSLIEQALGSTNGLVVAGCFLLGVGDGPGLAEILVLCIANGLVLTCGLLLDGLDEEVMV
jgi:hypothetical protein